ncbi:dynamin family protein [Streptomyces poonensis]|uniref:Isoniazid-induced protein IniC n=1 Tax=Streptomyces poonensis TaxID=68255 RepID=A0A918PCJ1_9ACTN|nr:dynamin family protein [Streptomyces poonensis]GGY99348.1 isoniazid-induced protein IniC [Streptomyces poonensis]
MPVRPVAEAVDHALRSLPGGPAAQPVRDGLLQAREALGAPLCVAVVGQLSSGKSTLVNALIGKNLLATGTTSVTPAVWVLRPADTPSVTVHFTDGRPPLACAPAELRRFTARGVDGSVKSTAVDHVEIRGPYPYLRTFDVMDTPGIGSGHDADAARHIRRADAVIAVLNTAVAQRDAELLIRFRGRQKESVSLTPLTAIGVLTKVELLWPGEIGAECDDALALGRDHARRILADPVTKWLFHDVVPVCSKVAAGTVALTDAAFADLRALSAVPESRLRVHLDDLRTFATQPCDGLPLPPARRAVLVALLSPYGLFRSARFIREGVGTVEELRRVLDEAHGMATLRHTLSEHFGRRSDLIKTSRIVDWAHGCGHRLTGADPRVRTRVTDALRPITALGEYDPAFAELRLLRQWYERELDISDEDGAELARAAGERGTSAARRLGADDTATLRCLEEAALDRVAHWRRLQAVGGPDRRHVALVLERRYTRLHDQVRRARILLGETDG